MYYFHRFRYSLVKAMYGFQRHSHGGRRIWPCSRPPVQTRSNSPYILNRYPTICIGPGKRPMTCLHLAGMPPQYVTTESKRIDRAPSLGQLQSGTKRSAESPFSNVDILSPNPSCSGCTLADHAFLQLPLSGSYHHKTSQT